MNHSSASTLLPPTDSAGDDDESQLLSSFKAAAVAVTKLYRAANQDIDRAKEQGYLNAVDDVLKIIASGQDVYEWAVRRKFGEFPDEQMQSDSKPAEESMGTDSHTSTVPEMHGVAQQARSMDFTMTGSEFTFRSDLQLDRSHPLPSAASVEKNARDVLMITPDDILFHAVSAQLEEEQRIEQERVQMQQQLLQQQQQQQQQQHDHEQYQHQLQINAQLHQSMAQHGNSKRRTGHDSLLDMQDSKSNVKRHRY